MANIIDAIINLVENPVLGIDEDSSSRGNNRANNMGDALEDYVKDLFASSMNVPKNKKAKEWSKVFSWTGNKSNPPDAMIRGGDAIEIKKISTPTASLPLNSSYPKHSLKASSSLISNGCKVAEPWDEKDMIYTVGVVKNEQLKSLCMVYGNIYCASENCYKDLFDRIKNSIISTEGIDFTDSNELGHINRVDPLGITYMRMRGMWGIDNPWKVFDYIYQKSLDETFSFMCIIPSEKWERFENKDRLISLANTNDNLWIKDEQVQNPDNPMKWISVKLIRYCIKEVEE